MTIKDADLFISNSTLLTISAGETHEVKVPKMMPNDEFTKQFTAVTASAQDITNVALVSNVFINILLSSAMTFLWGLLHCMQIVAHFDLVNIMMPANAHHMFKILV